MEGWIRLLEALWAVPAVRTAARYGWFLSGVSGCFWLVSWFFGQWALYIHGWLIGELADLFAIIYNVVLAVIFSALIVLSILVLHPAARSFGPQAAGFVFVYLALGAAYTDPSCREVDEHSILGYLAGLGAYLVFSIFPHILMQPSIIELFSGIVWMANGWVGWVLAGFGVLRGVYVLSRRLRGFFSLHPRIRVRT